MPDRPQPAQDSGDEAERLAEVERARAERLESELELAERRLRDAEQAGAANQALLIQRERELEAARSELSLPSARLTAPLRKAERALGWAFEQAAKVAGSIARHLAFRARRRG